MLDVVVVYHRGCNSVYFSGQCIANNKLKKELRANQRRQETACNFQLWLFHTFFGVFHQISQQELGCCKALRIFLCSE